MSGLIISLALLLILVAATALLTLGGLWRALVTFFNVLTAACIATAWYETLAGFLDKYLASYTYLLDFLSLWLIFTVVFSLLRAATDRFAPHKVEFPQLVDWIGGGVVSFLAAWVLVAFTAASLHTAPVPRDVIQSTPEAKMFFGLAPDRKWLAWVRNSSLSGPFSRGEPHVFDKDGDFILRYADRRLKLEQSQGLRVSAK
jgi:Colicin V production protein